MPIEDSHRSDYTKFATNPETWLFSARKQMAVAELLFRRREELMPGSGKTFEEFSGCSVACFMHAGFAIENAVKAVLVARDPSIIRSDGKLDRKKFGKSGHELLQLVASVIPDLSDTDRNLLLKLEYYVLWAGRYPIPTDGALLSDRNVKSLLRVSPFDERTRIEKLFEQLVKLTGNNSS